MEDYMMTNISDYDTMDEIMRKILEEYNMIDNHKTWAVPEYSKRQINNAGKTIANPHASTEERDESLKILNNWRAAHAYPLQIICDHLRKHNKNANVVQRLKRLESIVGKIERFPDMQLYKMQDLGGCRVIVDSISEVYEAIEQYKNSRIRHKLKREYDYIQHPKDSGYRCYHMVYQYHSDKNETYNKNILIEIQFRTKLQHIWATAVEMMALVTRSNLKASQGNEDILRFFTLVSSLFAIEEHTPVCPNTSNDENELLKEINDLNQKHHIIDTLNALSKTIQITEHNNGIKNKKREYYVLALNYKARHVDIYGYSKGNIDRATFVYNQLESKATNNENIVLVSADSMDLLKLAYPNYFADIHTFINILNKYNTKSY